MLRFFSKIRLKLAAENKPVKYMRYALGEIVLVVIGILIALQINNLKTEHDDKKTEILVLQSLKEDLQKDTVDLNRLIDYKRNQLEASREMMHYFVNPDYPIKDTLDFYYNMSRPFYFITDDPNRTAIEIAKGSGNLFKVTKDSLVNALVSYFSSTDLSNYLAETKRFSGDYVMVLLKRYRTPTQFSNYTKSLYTGHKEPKFQVKEFLTDYEMENYYISIILRLELGISMINNRKSTADNLIKLVDTELQNLKK